MPEGNATTERTLKPKIIKVFTESSGEVRISFTTTNPITADAIWRALPIESNAQRWGDEIYFKIPVKASEERSQTIVDVGDVAYWPPGKSMCIFFGRTPVSEGQEPRAYSPVNVFGKTLGDPLVFKKVKNGERIAVERG